MQKFIIDIQELKVAVDIVVISKEKDEKYLLLIKRKYTPFEGKWAIPGGFVNNHEELEEAALRELKEETGFTKVKELVQVETFGKVNRDPRKRVISIVYLIISEDKPALKPSKGEDNDTTEAKWFKLAEIPYPLAFDHDQIVKKTLNKFNII